MGLYTDWQVSRDLHRTSCEVYDVATNSWATFARAKYDRAFGYATATGTKKIYVFGGMKYETNRQMTDIKQIEEYDILSNQWKEYFIISELSLVPQRITIKQMSAMFCSNDQNLIIFGGGLMNKATTVKPNTADFLNSVTNFNLKSCSVTLDERLPENIKIDNLTSFPYNYAIYNNKVYIYYISHDESKVEINQCLVYNMMKTEKKWDLITRPNLDTPPVVSLNNGANSIIIINGNNNASTMGTSALRKSHIRIIS